MESGAFAAIAASVAVVSLGGPLPEHPGFLIAAWILGGAAWAWAAHRSRRIGLRAVVVGALVLRLLVLVGDPGLTDDLYRYVWEGGLVARGESPYGIAPSAPERAAERALWPDVYAGINHADVPAAYPPGAQAAHAAVTVLAGGPGALGRSLLGMRLLYSLADLACLVPLVLLLRRRGLPDGAALVWGWSPLCAIEFAGSGHFDSLGILGLLVAIVLAGTGERHSASAIVTLALGALIKLLPLLVLPFLARRRLVRGAVLFAVVFVLGWAPFALVTGPELFRGLSEYALRWEAGSLVYRWVELPFAAFLERDGGPLDARRVARVAVGLVWLAVVVREWRRPRDLVRSAGVAVGALLVLSPTLHPWYLAWAVPFVALRPSRSWLVLLVLAPLLYAPLAAWHAEEVWREPAWLWPALAVPFFALRAIELARET